MVPNRVMACALPGLSWSTLRYSTSALAYWPATKYLSARERWREALAFLEQPEERQRAAVRQRKRRTRQAWAVLAKKVGRAVPCAPQPPTMHSNLFVSTHSN